MLVENMETVFKIFFRGMKTIRVTADLGEEEEGPQQTKNYHNAFKLKSLARQKIVATRVRADTRVR